MTCSAVRRGAKPIELKKIVDEVGPVQGCRRMHLHSQIRVDKLETMTSPAA